MSRRLFRLLFLAAALTPLAIAPPTTGAATCESLSSLQLLETTILSATSIPAGSFDPPGGTPPSAVPAFCRVVARVAPAINFELWMPATTWNGKFQGVGNGGLAGSIGYGALVEGLNRGYAIAGTDTGHMSGAGNAWLLDIGLVTDYSHRGLHEMTVKSKALIEAFYGRRPAYSYYTGCSTGGKQGLFEALRYPDDYDGVIAGEHANWWSRIMDEEVWIGLATFKPENRIPTVKLNLLTSAVLAACDGLDGIMDNVLNDPRGCDFKPELLLCTGADLPACLTAGQVEAARKIYQGPRNPRTGEQLFPGLTFGSEPLWTGLINRDRAGGSADAWFQFAVYGNPSPAWDWTTFDFDRSLADTQRLAPISDSTDPDLTPFKSRGGKLIVYEGFSDQTASSRNPIQYYNRVTGVMGRNNTLDFYRLFMVPGMRHCSGGPGTDNFDMLTALEQWVEQGIAPERVSAAHRTGGIVDRTRPLCPYPQIAKYTGSGSTDDEANFACMDPTQALIAQTDAALPPSLARPLTKELARAVDAHQDGDDLKGRSASLRYGAARYWVQAYVDRLQKAVKAKRVSAELARPLFASARAVLEDFDSLLKPLSP
jgi:feruloyl esterase